MTPEQILAALLSSPHTVVVGATRDGVIDAWSRGATALYGWTAEEVVGRPLSVLAPPDRAVEQHARLCLYDGQPLPAFETVRLRKDGTEFPVELHVVPVCDDEGQVVGTAAVHRDLARSRGAETALEASQEELRARFLDSPVPQSRVDLTGRVLVVNAAMEELLGQPADELVGADALAMFVPEDLAGLEAALADLASGRTSSVRQDRTLQRTDGRPVPIVMTVTVVPGVGGEPVLAAVVEDVTALRVAEDRLRGQASRFDALLESTPVAVFTYDADGVCTSSRGRALDRLGYGQDELVGVCLLDVYRGQPQVVSAVRGALEGRDSRLLEQAAGGWWDVHHRPLRGAAGAVTGGIGIAVDVTDLVKAEDEVRSNEARLQALLRHSGDLVLVVDTAGRLLWVSPAVEGVLGLDPKELFWQPARELVHPDDVAALEQAWSAAGQSSPGQAMPTCRLRRADGAWRWFDVHVADLREDPAVAGVVVNLRDQTERLVAEREVERLALHDPLTGLPNRALLLDRIGQALMWGQKQGLQSGVVVLGVAGMTGLNEAVGHEVGDLLLCMVAGRLQEAVRSTDSVARVGGDRFAVLVEDVSSAEELRTRARTLLDAVEGPVPVDGIDIELRFRTGLARTPATSAGALLSQAEGAMAGSTSGDRAVAMAQGRPAGDVGTQRDVRELREAIAQDALRLHFQPVMSLVDGSLAGVEALVRWEHPERGLLPPAEFVPLAEDGGLIVDLGAWVLREACTWSARWQREGHAFGVGLNLSPLQMVDRSLVHLVAQVLRETGAPAEGLVLEVTESAVMDVPTAAGVLEDLRRLGVKLALDDFGTGYSSLTYLRRFPVDALKVDRSFVAGLGNNADDEAIVASIASLGRSVGKIVVAEGVETAGQLQALRALGVQQAQGFYWSRALPGEELVPWYESARPRTLPPAAPPAARTLRAARVETVPADAPQILRLHQEGASLHTIAAVLNGEGKRTLEGRRWTTTTVARVVAAAARP